MRLLTRHSPIRPSGLGHNSNTEAMTYTMSKDYDAPYDLLCGGGEAFARVVYSGCEVDAKWLHKPVPSKTMSLRTLTNYGGIYTAPELEQRSQFIEHCQRMELQWLAPVDIAEIIAAGDQAIRMWHEELKADGWDSSTSLDLASGEWITATAKHRTT